MRFSPKKVLVVEDEPAIQQVLCFFLRQNGFEVLAASSGQEAIRVIPEFVPHLMILDLIMRPVSGWDVLHWLRSTYLSPPFPVIVLSALVHLNEQLQGFEEGAVEYITKPVQPGTIVERVRSLLTLNSEQLGMLQHKRMGDQRRLLERLAAASLDEWY